MVHHSKKVQTSNQTHPANAPKSANKYFQSSRGRIQMEWNLRREERGKKPRRNGEEEEVDKALKLFQEKTLRFREMKGQQSQHINPHTVQQNREEKPREPSSHPREPSSQPQEPSSQPRKPKGQCTGKQPAQENEKTKGRRRGKFTPN
ncbi:hypothetical protein MA16_Dca016833 [Dendrobium catenatum]|uniref:Uncharacterized protein n=1 Tax=Dendrobium catenatum TaxID=906689 RepID=A0A2I0VYI6_9ASPA|nr:hypothetical protein MA16_Dca016833 [Dendrobium catenatum]